MTNSEPFRGQLSRKMAMLFAEKVRYRVARGGRGASKSYGFADMAIGRMLQRKTPIVVCRELRTTIRDSVHRLLKDRIDFYGYTDSFEITDNRILCRGNDSELVYEHLHNNDTEVKGLEGREICWIFEAQNVSKESWVNLDPTIRRTPGMLDEPEFWIEFNTGGEDDFIYQRFISHPPDNAVVSLINYVDNPWCPADLKKQAEECKRDDPEAYEHIWMGGPRNVGSLIYPHFDPEVHVRTPLMSRFEQYGMFFMGQDPHTVYYPFCVWVARLKKGDEFDYVVYNEWPTRRSMGGKLYHEVRKEKKCQLTLKQRAQMFKILDNTLEQTHGWLSVKARGIDTRFAKGSGAASTTSNTRGIIVEMADQANGGLMFETPPEHMIDVQRDRIRELLDYDRDMGINEFNEPHLFVMEHCENVIDSLKYHRFDRDGKEREDETRKDPVDALKIALATAQQYGHEEDVVEVEIPKAPAVGLAEAWTGDNMQIHLGPRHGL